MKKSLYYLLLTLFAVALLSSCKKDNDIDDNDTQATEDQSVADTEAGKAFEAIDRSVRGSSDKTGEDSGKGFLPECAKVTVDTVSATRRVEIDFGTTGCVCSEWDGKTRKGKIITTYTGKYAQAGTVITTKTENYFVDDKEHRINKTVENKGKNSAGNTYFYVTVANSVVTPNGTISWQAKRMREWIKGENTPTTASDDQYSITDVESATGTNRKGVNFTVRITQPIIVKLACKFKLVAGELELSIDGKEKRTINYGNGGCDGQFDVTIKGKKYKVGR